MTVANQCCIYSGTPVYSFLRLRRQYFRVTRCRGMAGWERGIKRTCHRVGVRMWAQSDWRHATIAARMSSKQFRRGLTKLGVNHGKVPSRSLKTSI